MNTKSKNDEASQLSRTESSGPWPFVTRRVYQTEGQAKRVWSSRHHRKGLQIPGEIEAKARKTKWLSCLWMPGKLNWWIGTVFALGSFLFALASVLSLSPSLAKAWALDANQTNAIFFAGSIPFTIAGYLQLFQAANAADVPGTDTSSSARTKFFGWQPHDIGWLSAALQFTGTILFNFNTFDAMLPSLNWFQQDLVIWAPNIFGSILFLMSGYLGFIETCHSYWAFQPKVLSWWVVFINLLGCVGFMISALFSIFLPGPENAQAITTAVAFTLQGAICFFVGSLLMLPESSVTQDAE